ncbi:unnamed protein product [Prorocentrum cordatum]|uniref:Uncharacterized protein n=1 Tax=Prorocentrum cordatum TaxID=2364126 RepID=A0ABN9UAY2_9DINO|nr:unnamed protein product [Polarella glacialis]
MCTTRLRGAILAVKRQHVEVEGLGVGRARPRRVEVVLAGAVAALGIEGALDDVAAGLTAELLRRLQNTLALLNTTRLMNASACTTMQISMALRGTLPGAGRQRVDVGGLIVGGVWLRGEPVYLISAECSISSL